MNSDLAFWEAVVAVAPLLALAAVVELRLTRWHRFSPFSRWIVGFLGGLVLIALGASIITALQVLQAGRAGAVSLLERDIAYWSIYGGVWAVILFPVSQLWVVVFADMGNFRIYMRSKALDRQLARTEKSFSRTISMLMRQRQWCSELIYETVIARPGSAFVPTAQGGYRLHITDPKLIRLRKMASEMDEGIRQAEKDLKKGRRKVRKIQKKEVKVAGRASARAARRFESYQGVWR